MAKIEFKGIEEYAKQLAALGKAAEGVCKYAVYDAAGLVADTIAQNCPKDSGDLAESVGISKFKNDNGFIHVKIGFDGYDSKGVPNSLKARVLESGRSSPNGKVGKHPFIRQSVNRVKSQAESLIQFNLDKKIYDIMQSKG